MTSTTSDNIRIYLAVLGHGKVGGEFIDQVLKAHDSLLERNHIDLRIFAIANSRCCILSSQGIGSDWRSRIASATPVGAEQEIHSLITLYAQDHDLDRLIVVDNTSSEEVARAYQHYISLGYDVVSSNKKANTLPWREYMALRRCLAQYDRSYRYETNVGAGLPLIDNIKLLHLSGERIRHIRGVFSGSLSYIFNQLDHQPTSALKEIVSQAIQLGYAEPDVRDDLSGEDVARKLLILARELDIPWQLEDVEVENIVPTALRGCPYETFAKHFDLLVEAIEHKRSKLPQGHILRYVAQVSWDDETEQASLGAGLIAVPKSSTLGSLSAADCCFEIYTESYGDRPITVQGAGAGVKVTARGVFGDVLRLCYP